VAAGLRIALILIGGCRPESGGPVVPTVRLEAETKTEAECCKVEPGPMPEASPEPTVAARPQLPDVPVRNHRGE